MTLLQNPATVGRQSPGVARKLVGKAVKRKIAHGLATNKPYPVVAAEAGVGYSTVAHLVRDEEVVAIRAEIERKHADLLDQAYRAVVESAVKDVADADAGVRRQAREQLMGILVATDPAGSRGGPSSTAGGYTLEQIFAVFTGGE